MNNELKNIIEALLMVSDVPVGVSKIQGLFDNDAAPEAAEIKEAIEELNKDCELRSVEVKKIGSGYRFQTKPQYAEWIRKMQAGRPPRLSRAQLETLAIIAYRQPVTRGDIEEIRGVADAKATEIYASAYNQSAEAVEFYEFTRTMQSYQDIIANNSTLVLSTDSDLFKFLKGMNPDK